VPVCNAAGTWPKVDLLAAHHQYALAMHLIFASATVDNEWQHSCCHLTTCKALTTSLPQPVLTMSGKLAVVLMPRVVNTLSCMLSDWQQLKGNMNAG